MATLDQLISFEDAQGQKQELPLRVLLTLTGQDMAEARKSWGFAQDFRDVSYESVLDRLLARIPNEVDKRQGSIIYDTLAPLAVEIAELQFERQHFLSLGYAVSSVGKWLDLRVGEHGIHRMPATKAVRIGYFYKDKEKIGLYDQIPMGHIYSVPNIEIYYEVTRKLGVGAYELTCTQKGNIGNEPQEGTMLLPQTLLDGLALVELSSAISPGQNEESDEELFERFVDFINNPPFGGNRADYRRVLRKVNGVGGNKLYRADSEKGYVRIVILGDDGLPPSQALIDHTQEKIDPFDDQKNRSRGQGTGLAPMCHYVTIEGAQPQKIDMSVSLLLKEGVSAGQIKPQAEKTLSQYFAELRKHWDDLIATGDYRYSNTIVRVAVINALLLEIEGVADVKQVLLNGTAENIIIDDDFVPILGDIAITG